MTNIFLPLHSKATNGNGQDSSFMKGKVHDMEGNVQDKVNISAPNLSVICIDGEADDNIFGRLYHCYSKENLRFENAVVLLNLMQDFFDSISYPQAARAERSFVGYNRKPTTFSEKVAEQKEIIRERGILKTYIAHVQFRQNSTWQGDVFCVETGKKYRFISELEFIKLLKAGS